MHILIIPSERYLPADKPLEGIFQRDQAMILKNNGFQIGILSISLKYSYFMLMKAFVYKILKLKIVNELKNYDFFSISKFLFYKMCFPSKYISTEIIDEIPVIRIESSYSWFLSPKNEYRGWIYGGLQVFKKYMDLYGKPDIIHSHNMVYAGILATEIKRRYKVPVAVTEHSSYYASNLFKPFTLKKVENSLKQINEFLTVSESLGSFLMAKFKALVSFEVVPNVLDDLFINSPFDLKITSETFTFINIGSFITIKGQCNLIKAFSLKFRIDKRFRLKIIGGGELKDELENLAILENVGEQVELIETIPRNQIIKELDKADVFVFSSNYETFGVALIEALSRGLPVVSTKCGGPESIVNSSNGLLVENNNIEALAQGLICIKDKFENYNSIHIREQCLTEYCSESFYKKIIQVYTKAINHDS